MAMTPEQLQIAIEDLQERMGDLEAEIFRPVVTIQVKDGSKQVLTIRGLVQKCYMKAFPTDVPGKIKDSVGKLTELIGKFKGKKDDNIGSNNKSN